MLQTMEYSPFYSINFQQIFVILTFLNSVFLGGFFGIHIDIIWRKKYFSFQKWIFLPKNVIYRINLKVSTFFFLLVLLFLLWKLLRRMLKGSEHFYQKSARWSHPRYLIQGKLIAVASTPNTYWNQFFLGGICKQEYMYQCSSGIR